MTEESGIKALVRSVTETFREVLTKPGLILTSTFIGMMIWGPLGRPLFSPLLEPWIQADPVTLGFRRELVSYLSGFLLLVIVPLLLVRFRFKEPLRDFGLGLGDVRLGVLFTVVFILLTLVPFYFTATNQAMWAEYPLLFKGLTDDQIRTQFSWPYFIQYELVYAVFFFVIEFTFRGWLLFGLERQFGIYAVFVQMLPYTAWHLAKPLPELLPVPIFGLVVGAITLRVRSVWYIFIAHWLLNVFLDTTILHARGIW